MTDGDEHELADTAATTGCVSCGSPSAGLVDTTEGRLLMCQPCVAIHNLGCP